MKKLRIGVIGLGAISSYHLDAIMALDNAELAAVCDIKPERLSAASKKYGATGYSDYNEMFQKENLDAVHLCLPHYIHCAVANDAFKCGINVLTEKPMDVNYTNAQQAVENAERAGVKFGVIFQCRYNTPSLIIKQRIQSGKLGRVLCANLSLTWSRSDDYYSGSDWKGTWDKEGGGVIIDQAIHSLDLANWMIDSIPLEIQSSLNNRNHKIMRVEDTAEGIIKYENGAILSFYAMNNFLTNEPIKITLICENGSAELSYEYADIKYNNGETEHIDNSPQKIVSYEGGKDYWGTQHAVQINQFYNSLLGLEDLEISGREALKTHKIICDIYKNNSSSFKTDYNF